MAQKINKDFWIQRLQDHSLGFHLPGGGRGQIKLSCQYLCVTYDNPNLRLRGQHLSEVVLALIEEIVDQVEEKLAQRLRRCDECGNYFLAKGDHRRAHSFCREPCRRLFDQKHRDPTKQAEYMRAYRQRKKRIG